MLSSSARSGTVRARFRSVRELETIGLWIGLLTNSLCKLHVTLRRWPINNTVVVSICVAVSVVVWDTSVAVVIHGTGTVFVVVRPRLMRDVAVVVLIYLHGVDVLMDP